jgi:hypothetical protein
VLNGSSADGEPLGPGDRGRLTEATGLAEREAASILIQDVPGRHRITVGADQVYSTTGLRRWAAPVQRQAARGAEHLWPDLAHRPPDRAPLSGYLASQRTRKRIEEAFAWNKDHRRPGQH